MDEVALREDAALPAVAAHQIPVFKKTAELFAALAGDSAGFDAVSLRIGTVWGPLGLPDNPFTPLPRLLSAAVRGEDPDLTPPRPPAYAEDATDLCYVKDCGRAIALLMLAERLNHRTYNVSSGRPVRYGEVVAAINAAVPGADIALPEGRNPDRPPDNYLDTTRLRDGHRLPAGVRRRARRGGLRRLAERTRSLMARVVMQAVVSVDGYIAYPDDTVGPLFDWYFNGDTELSARPSGWTFRVSRASADYVQPFWDAIKVTVIGRHLFDTTNGWDGKPAAGDELVVVTHRPLPESGSPTTRTHRSTPPTRSRRASRSPRSSRATVSSA